jgi:hypothetical protein
MKYFFRFLLCAFAVVTIVSPSDAVEAPPPQQLLGKSIVVMWSENRVQRAEGTAKFKDVPAALNMSLYIGTSGRIFSRLTGRTRLGSGRTEHVQEESAAEPQFRERTTTFADQSVTVVLPFRQGGMRRLLIELGDSFDKCSAKLSYVTEAGSLTSLARSPITKKMVEIKSIKMSGESCSVLSRNVFEDE